MVFSKDNWASANQHGPFWSNTTYETLRRECRSRGLPTWGSRAELEARLRPKKCKSAGTSSHETSVLSNAGGLDLPIAEAKTNGGQHGACSMPALSAAPKANVKIRDGDALLSATGERQLGFELTAQPSDFVKRPIIKVFCSPLRRALLTAIAAYPDHRIIVDPRLREISASKGMSVSKLRSWLKKVRPTSVDNVDFSRVPTGVWWGVEDTNESQRRLSSILSECGKARAKSGVVALVTHSVAMRCMAGCPIRPFPKDWGTPRGWPKNFKPYFARIQTKAAGQQRIVSASQRSAGLVLVRHAHSAKQAARTAEKKARKRKLAQGTFLKSRRRRS